MNEVRRAAAALEVRGLDVYYGHSHALQGVDLTLDAGVFSVVGRNGMGKTTLCKTIMGLVPASGGSIRVRGEDITGGARRISRGSASAMCRRVAGSGARSASTSICGLPAGMRPGAWTVERIYDTFPRLAERKDHGGGQLSGGEQQMLAISRALVTNPHLLIMDEPTEGLAPVIVAQVEEMLLRLGEDGDMAVLVIEQNIGVATAVSRNVAIMVNGRINRIIDSRAACRRPRVAAAPARRRTARRARRRYRRAGDRHRREALAATCPAERPDADLHLQPDAADALVPTRADRPYRSGGTHALDRRRAARRVRAPQARAGNVARHPVRRSCWSSARSTPRAPSSASFATSSLEAACARGWSTSPPAASRPPATSRRRKSRSTTGAAARPCSVPTAAPP